MSARYLVEVWNRTNTTRQLVLQPSAAERHRVIGGEETLAVDLDLPAEDSALVRGAVLRLVREGDATDLTLWRVTRRTRSQREDGGQTYHLEADALWGDLRHGRVRQLQSDGSALFVFGLLGITPSSWLGDVILPGYDGGAVSFALGVVEITTPVDLTFDHPTSPLEALRMLEQVTRGEINFRVSPDGLTYTVDLLERIGQAGGGAQLRYARNIRGLELIEDEADIVTRLYAQGGGLLTLADADWEVTAIAGTAAARVLTFRKSPVFEDGAFVDLYFRVGSASYAITASDVELGTITVDEGANAALTAGVRGYLTTDLAGTRLAYLESPSAAGDFGVRTGDLPDASDVPDASNLLSNGDFADWTAGAPDHWTLLGAATVAKDTTLLYGQHGGAAAHLVATADGDGLISDAFAVSSSDRRPYLGMMAGLTVISGQVRLELRHSNGLTYPLTQQAGSKGVGSYISPSAGPVHDEPLPAGTAQMAVVAHGGAAEWYLDVAMVTPQVASDVPGFVRDEGAWLLWDRAVDELAARSVESREYRVSIVDLYRVDPSRFAFDQLGLGDDVRVQHPDFGEETLRIVDLDEDLLHAEAVRVSLALDAFSRPAAGDDVFRPRYRPRRSAGAPVPPQSDSARILQHGSQYDAATATLNIYALGSAVVATIDIYTRTAADVAYPVDPTATIAGRGGTVAVDQGSADQLLYRLVPRDASGIAGEVVEDEGGRKGPAGNPGANGSSAPRAFITSIAASETAETLQYDGVPGSSGNDALQWRRSLDAGTTWSDWLDYSPLSSPTEIINRKGFWSVWVKLEIRDGLLLVGEESYSVHPSGGGVIQPPPPGDAGGGWIPNTAPIGSLGGRQVGQVDLDAQAGASADTDLTGLDTGGWINRSGTRILAIDRSGFKTLGGSLFQRAVDTLNDVVDSPTFRRVAIAFTDTSNRLVNVFRSGVTESAANLFKRGVDTLDSVQDSPTLKRTTTNEKLGAGYGYNGLDSGGYAKVGVRPAALIGSTTAGQLEARAVDVMRLDFTTLPSDAGGAESIVAEAAASGGKVLRATNDYYPIAGHTLSPPLVIPFDRTKLYRVRVRMRTVQDNTDQVTNPNELFYAGVVRINSVGTAVENLYVAASARRVLAADGWQTFTGWLQGTGASHDNAWAPQSPSGVGDVDCSYLAPVILINYASPAGQITDVDFFEIAVIDEDAAARTYTAIEAGGARLSPIPWRRGAGGVDMLPTEPFRLGVESLDNVSQGSARRWVDSNQVNSIGQLFAVLRQSVYEAVDNLGKKSVDFEVGATVGAKAGVNLRDSGGNTLSDAQVITAQGQAAGLATPDTRAVNTPPSGYGVGVWHEFKQRSAIGAPGGAFYGALETVRPYWDNSGGYATQTFRSSDGVFKRSAPVSDPAWGAWQKVFDGQNLPNLDSEVTDGSTYKRTTTNEKTGAGRAYDGTNSSGYWITHLQGLLDIIGSLHVPASGDINVGSAATQEYRNKSIVLPYTAFRAVDSAAQSALADFTAYMSLTARSTGVAGAPLVLPPGAEITQIDFYSYRQAVDCLAELTLYRLPSTGGSTLLVDLLHNTTGWQVRSWVGSEIVTDQTFILRIALDNGGTSNSMQGAQFAWVRVHYRVKNFSDTY